MLQNTNNIMLVKPARFAYNAETAVTNAFQVNEDTLTPDEVQARVEAEFDAFAATLRAHGVNAMVFEDTRDPHKPDSIFPNNWVTFHTDGTVILYPMCAPNRRLERRMDIIERIGATFSISKIVDLSASEELGKFLEGTGSIVFDHTNKTAYACLSPRTDKGLLDELGALLDYKVVTFYSRDRHGKEVYHTNVMMCIGTGFAVVCLSSITDEQERTMVQQSLESTGHEIVDITHEQMEQFAGNMLSVTGTDGKTFLVMSQSAFDALTDEQKNRIGQYDELLPIPIHTIETIGGGSARCMMAQVFLPAQPSTQN